MQHADSLLNIFGYYFHVHDFTVFHVFQTFVSNQLSTSVIWDLGIRALHIICFW
jgi:hypothetical protein